MDEIPAPTANWLATQIEIRLAEAADLAGNPEGAEAKEELKQFLLDHIINIRTALPG